MQVQNLMQFKTLARQTLEHQLRQPELEKSMLKFLQQHQGKELQVSIEIKMEPKNPTS